MVRLTYCALSTVWSAKRLLMRCACSLYIDLPGVSELPQGAIGLSHTDSSIEVRVTVAPKAAAQATGTGTSEGGDGDDASMSGASTSAVNEPTTVHVLKLGPLYGSVAGVSHKAKKDTLTITVTKATEGTWWNLTKHTGGGGYGGYGGDYDFDD